MIWTVCIPGWHPTPLNQLVNCHWATRGRLKKKDYQIVGTGLLAYGVQPATSRRRVSLFIVLPPRKRASDPDSLHKVVLDALVHHKALVDDNRQWVELGPVEWARGKQAATYLTLEDLDGGLTIASGLPRKSGVVFEEREQT